MSDQSPRPVVPGAEVPSHTDGARLRSASTEPRRLDSRQLFGSRQEIEIDHAGAIYRLRRTALGKLILTK